ncbi:MAG: formylglycine-generating enzyme family protein [Planctomycetota bacterium]
MSVRLSVFAELMRGRDWTSDSLASVGGADGVGVAFLEESFTARDASPLHKRHADAAQRMLRSLLPPLGAEIKGHNRTGEELQVVADYGRRPDDYQELIKILNDELRLITLTFDEENNKIGYQLTHDYLVPSLRTWLARKQSETRRGRAELRLEERAATWTAKQENRQLPSFAEFTRIAALTSRSDWTPPQRRMMRRATWFHLIRAALVSILVTLAGVAAFAAREWQRIGGLTAQIISASPDQILAIAQQLDHSPNFADSHLKHQLAVAGSATEAAQRRLHAQLALVARDPSHVAPLRDALLAGKYAYAIPIRERLRLLPATQFQTLTEELRSLLHGERVETHRRFGAALALAAYIPITDETFWTAGDLAFVARELVSANPEFQPELRRALRPIESRFRGELERIYTDAKATDAQRLAAANAFADYARRDNAKLTELLTMSTPAQFEVVYPLVESSRTEATLAALRKVAAELPPDQLGTLDRIPFGKRRADAAAALLRLGEREPALSVFAMKDDPEALTQFIFRCRPRGVAIEEFLDCLEMVSSAPPTKYPKGARYALLLALGEFTREEVPESRRKAVLEQLRDWYAKDPSSSVHGATAWLLRHWGDGDFVKRIDETETPPSPDREWFTLAVKLNSESPGSSSENAASADSAAQRTFYYTFIVVPPGEYSIGSPKDDPDYNESQHRRQVRLTRSYAILNREVTFAEIFAINRVDYERTMKRYEYNPETAVISVSWYDAVFFCCWLTERSGRPQTDQVYVNPQSPSIGPQDRDLHEKWSPLNWPTDFSRHGFRLPTEAEWEVACHEGFRTPFGFGGDDRLLDKFGWFLENSNKKTIYAPFGRRPSLRSIRYAWQCF